MLSIFFVRKGGKENKFIRLAGLLLCLLGLGALVLYGVLGTKQGNLSLLGTVFLYAALTQAWNILGGYGGYLNFGTATFFGVGAYTTGVLFQHYGLSPFLTAPLAGLVAAVLGVAIGIPTLRLRGAYFAIVTMIITFAIQILVFSLPFTQGAMGIFLPPLNLSPIALERLFYFLFLTLAVVVTLLVYAIQNSNFGWALVAIREDEDAAEVIGVKTTMVKYIANAIATFIIGVLGGLYAQRIMYIDPTGAFSFDTSLNVVLMAVIGGAGTWQGPLIAAPLIIIVADMLRVTFTSEVNRVIFSIVVILIALYLPHGAMGFITSLRQKYLEWRKPQARDEVASV
jgi:branched-chain amino acid transport system permease protein